MLINDKRKIIFIHIPKTAGRTIKASLCKNIKGCRTLDVSHRSYQLFLNKQDNPEKYNTYFKFTVIRDPLSRLYSLFTYRYFLHLRGDPRFRKWYKMYKHGFNYWVRKCWNTDKDLAAGRDQCKKYLYSNGKETMDYVIRFEHLQNDFNVVCRKLGLKEIELEKSDYDKSKDRVKFVSFNEYKFDEDVVRMIKERFADDYKYIERLNRERMIS